MTTTAETLKAARNRLVDEGWVQGAYSRVGGGYCSVGAVREVKRSRLLEQLNSPLAEAVGAAMKWEIEEDSVLRALAVQIGVDDEHYSPEGVVAIWNDNPARTKEEVLALFDKAIHKEEGNS